MNMGEKLLFYLPYVIDDEETKKFEIEFKEQLTYFNKSKFEIAGTTKDFAFKKTFVTKINKNQCFKRYNIEEFWLQDDGTISLDNNKFKKVSVYFNNCPIKKDDDDEIQIILNNGNYITKNVNFDNKDNDGIIIIFKQLDKDYIYKGLIKVFSTLISK